MTLGLGVLLSLFLLAPGLAIHAALFPIGGARGIRFAPPPPNSVLALTIIGFSALVAHAAWGLLSAFNDGLCTFAQCFAVPFQPNLYTSMMSANTHTEPVSGADIAAALVTILLLSALAYLVAAAISASAVGRVALRGLRYGWLADFVDLAGGDNRFTTAFVLTTVEHDGAFLGYEGLVENLAVNSEREITAVSLLEVNRFLVQIGADGLKRIDIAREPIDRLYVERPNIKNVALTVFEEEEAAPE